MAQLLLVEDDAAIRGALIRALTERGHAVTSRPSAMTALQHVLDSPPDLILLDLGLPDLGGYEALRMMRAITSVPVVVVTARDDEAEIIRVLDAGADDYVIKPFGAGQIDARIRAVLRRAGSTGPGTSGPLEVGGLRLDPDAHEATLEARPLDLSRREFDLLHYLTLHAGQGRFGALRRHVDTGRLSAASLHAELGQIVTGARPGRERDDERILFWHRGLAILDIAVGLAILRRAEQQGAGTMLRYRS